MKITRVQFDRFKGINEEWVPARCTLLVGPNGSGKSARLEALRWAFQGDVAGGARPDDAMKLMGADGGGVTTCVQTPGGPFTWRRGLVKDIHTKTVTQECDVAGQRANMKLKESESLVAATVGTFTPMFDLGEFLRLSSEKRRAFVLGLCGGQMRAALDACAKAIIDFCAVRCRNHNIYAMSMTEAVACLSLADRVAIDPHIGAMMKAVDGKAGADLVAAAMDTLKAIISRTKKSHEQGREGARQLSEQKSQHPNISESEEALIDKIADARVRLQELSRQVGEIQGIERSIKDVEAEIVRMEASLAKWRAEAHALCNQQQKDLREDPAKLEAEAAELEKLEKPSDAAFDACMKLQAEVLKRYEEVNHELGNIKNDLHMLQSESGRVERKIRDLETGPWAKALELWRLADLETRGGRKHGAFLELGTFLSEQADVVDLAAMKTAIETAKGELAMLSALARAGEDEKATLNDRLNLGNYKADELRRKFQNELAKWDKDQAKARKLRLDATATRTSRTDIAKRLANLETEIATTESAQTAAQRRLAALREGLASPADLQTEMAGLHEAVRGLETKLQQRRALMMCEKELVDCVAKAESEYLSYDVAVGLLASLKGVREEYMESLIQPLLVKANEFLSYAKPGYQAYASLENDRGTPILELGWGSTDGSGPMPLPSMSGGEAGVFCAAIAYALVAISPTPVKLLLIEAAELDKGHLESVVSACAKVENLDHAVICYPEDVFVKNFPDAAIINLRSREVVPC